MQPEQQQRARRGPQAAVDRAGSEAPASRLLPPAHRSSLIVSRDIAKFSVVGGKRKLVKRIAVYGKGGSGKSTISAALSVHFARRGMKVLHVGCDPKADSTLTITDGRRIPTLLDFLGRGNLRPSADEFVVTGRHGIDCVEAGGPRPGAGCGGRGIARMFELFNDIRLLESGAYDMVVFDVLGDVVCGGFAAPLRLGFAQRAFIVVSEEPLSLFAANNISHAVRTYSSNGVGLGGLVLNVSDDTAAAEIVGRFAGAISARLVGTIPRDKAIQELERRHLTAAELPPESATRAAIARLADAVLDSFEDEPPIPEPLSTEELFRVLAPQDFPKVVEAEEGGNRSVGVKVSSTVPATSVVRAGEPDLARLLPNDRSVVAGPSARQKLGALLGLDRGNAAKLNFEVERFVFDAGFEIKLVSAANGSLCLLLQRTKDTGRTYAQVGDLAVSHTTPLNKTRRKVLDYVVGRLKKAGATYGAVAAILAADSESALGPTDRQDKDARRRKVESGPRHWTLWGKETMAGRFFFQEERRRLVLGEMKLGDGAITVHHGTEACQSSEQATTPSTTHFVRYPWRDVEYQPARFLGDRSLLSNITDYELIAGSNEALERVLSSVAARGGSAPVVIDVSCTPVIAGEDWQGTVDRFRSSYPGPVLASAVGGTDLSEVIAEAGLQALSRDNGEAPEPTGVHLIGFPPAAFTDELVALLISAGVPVHQRQLPKVSLAGLSDYRRASGQLLWPQTEYEALYAGLYEQAGVPAFRVAAPYGIEATRGFLCEAARAAGVPTETALSAAAEAIDRASAELAGLQPELAGIRLGIALASGQSQIIERPELVCGVPLVAFLDSLGFQVEVLTDADDEGRLNWWLRSGLKAVYSDLTYDRRLAPAGVGHFALADLEPGLPGAVRTARRLLALCKTPFYANYARLAGGGGNQ